MNINLHIEHLVLDGLPVTARQGELIQAAVESELARILGADGLPEMAGVALKNLSCEPIQLGRENQPAPTGNQIAQAVYSGLASLGTAPRLTPNGGRRDA
jgi:hypothetical protein